MNASPILVSKLRAVVSHLPPLQERDRIPPVVADALGAMGFQQGKSAAQRVAFFHHGKGLVFKLSYVVDEPPLRAIPTVVVHVVGLRLQWLLQPMATPIEAYDREAERLRRKFWRLPYKVVENANLFGVDAAPRNIGFYQDRFVVYDW